MRGGGGGEGSHRRAPFHSLHSGGGPIWAAARAKGGVVKSCSHPLHHHRTTSHSETFFLFRRISGRGGLQGLPESASRQAGPCTLGKPAPRRWQGGACPIWAASGNRFDAWRGRAFCSLLFSIAGMALRARRFIVGTMGTRELYSTAPQKASAFALGWLFPWLRCGLGSLGTQKARRGAEFPRACGSPACPPAEGRD